MTALIKYGCVVVNVLRFNDQELFRSLTVAALFVFYLKSISPGPQIGATSQGGA